MPRLGRAAGAPKPFTHCHTTCARLWSLKSALEPHGCRSSAVFRVYTYPTVHAHAPAEETKKERDGFHAFERRCARRRRRRNEEIGKEEATRRIPQLKEEERMAIEQLREAERERRAAAGGYAGAGARGTSLERGRRRVGVSLSFFRFYLVQHLTRFAFSTSPLLRSPVATDSGARITSKCLNQQNRIPSLLALRAAYVADSAALKRSSAQTCTICLLHPAQRRWSLALSNGLRLGRAPGVLCVGGIFASRCPDSDRSLGQWAEINAAWGQTLLLLYTIARKLDFHLRGRPLR